MNLFKNKKSNWGTVTTIIIIAVIIFILFPLIDDVIDVLTAKGQGLYSLPVHKLFLSRDSVIKYTLDESLKEKDKVTVSYLSMNKVLADEMADCLFRSKGFQLFMNRNWAISEDYCIVCSEIKFGKDMGQQITDFQDFLELEKITPLSEKVDSNDKISYIDHLTGKSQQRKIAYLGFGDEHKLIPGRRNLAIDPKQEYVIFVAGIKESRFKGFTKLKVFSNDDRFFVYIAPTMQLDDKADKELCSNIKN